MRRRIERGHVVGQAHPARRGVEQPLGAITPTGRTEGTIDRWRHARVCPFDGSTLDQHALATQAPDLVPVVDDLADRIIEAERGAIGVTHSDLHRAHLLTSADATLAGVLDFGDAFIGATAWDFAPIAWYYGKRNAQMVARHYDPGGEDAVSRGLVLAVAVGLYRLAKNPTDSAVMPRRRRCLEAVPIA